MAKHKKRKVLFKTFMLLKHFLSQKKPKPRPSVKRHRILGMTRDTQIRDGLVRTTLYPSETRWPGCNHIIQGDKWGGRCSVCGLDFCGQFCIRGPCAGCGAPVLCPAHAKQIPLDKNKTVTYCPHCAQAIHRKILVKKIIGSIQTSFIFLLSLIFTLIFPFLKERTSHDK